MKIQTVFQAALVAAVLLPCMHAQTMGRFKPACNPQLHVPDVDPAGLSCRQESAADFLVKGCAGEFIESIDKIADAADAFRNSVRLWQEGKSGLIGGVGARGAEGVQTLLGALETVGKLGAGIEVYIASCVTSSYLKEYPVLDSAVELVKSYGEGVEQLGKALPAIKERFRNGDVRLYGNEEAMWSHVQSANEVKGKAQGLKDGFLNAARALYEYAAGDESLSRTALGNAQSAAAACDLVTASNEMQEAGRRAEAALLDLKFRIAQQTKLGRCAAERVTEFFERTNRAMIRPSSVSPGPRPSTPPATPEMRADTDVPAWQNTDPSVLAAAGCGAACRQWFDARAAVNSLKLEIPRLTGRLIDINNACKDLRELGDRYADTDDRYWTAYSAFRDALAPGRCDLVQANRLRDQFIRMDENRSRDRQCGYSATRESFDAEYQRRRVDLDCNAGPSVPVSTRWSGTATGTCHLTYEGYTVGKDYIKPHAPRDVNHKMILNWNPVEKVYVITAGAQEIIGTPPNFDFVDTCSSGNRWEPGCVHKSRPEFSMSGSISIGTNTVTYKYRVVGQYNFDDKIENGVCTLTKDR